MGPMDYLKMMKVYGKKPLLARLEVNGRPVYREKIIARKEVPFDDLRAIKGKRFAFGDPASTMAHLIPRFVLWKAGVTVEDLGEYQFLISHTNVALRVLASDFDAGVVEEEVFYALEKQGLKAIATTPPLPHYVFVALSALPPETVQAVRAALYHLKDTATGRSILRGLEEHVTGMAPAQDTDYDNLREILGSLKSLGIEW